MTRNHLVPPDFLMSSLVYVGGGGGGVGWWVVNRPGPSSRVRMIYRAACGWLPVYASRTLLVTRSNPETASSISSSSSFSILFCIVQERREERGEMTEDRGGVRGG